VNLARGYNLLIERIPPDTETLPLEGSVCRTKKFELFISQDAAGQETGQPEQHGAEPGTGQQEQRSSCRRNAVALGTDQPERHAAGPGTGQQEQRSSCRRNAVAPGKDPQEQHAAELGTGQQGPQMPCKQKRESVQ
jgi:hypothetical protein